MDRRAARLERELQPYKAKLEQFRQAPSLDMQDVLTGLIIAVEDLSDEERQIHLDEILALQLDKFGGTAADATKTNPARKEVSSEHMNQFRRGVLAYARGELDIASDVLIALWGEKIEPSFDSFAKVLRKIYPVCGRIVDVSPQTMETLRDCYTPALKHTGMVIDTIVELVYLYEAEPMFTDDTEKVLLCHCTGNLMNLDELLQGQRLDECNGCVGFAYYFSDSMKRALDNIPAIWVDGKCVSNGLVLTEVALGRTYGTLSGKLLGPPQGKDSVLGLAQEIGQQKTVRFVDGTVGKIPIPSRYGYVSGSSFYHNEYVVYNPARARVRYLITFKHVSNTPRDTVSPTRDVGTRDNGTRDDGTRGTKDWVPDHFNEIMDIKRMMVRCLIDTQNKRGEDHAETAQARSRLNEIHSDSLRFILGVIKF